MAYSIQPTGWQYFQKKSSWHLPQNVTHLFYASWEDALWDMLRAKKIQAQSVILVPEFFCGDVVLNMQAHGLKIEWYPVNKSLQTDPVVFSKLLRKIQPEIVIIFHAVGISNTLFQNTSTWLKHLPQDSVLIEDSVHRVVEPHNIQLIHPGHVVIDSLRKVVPLAGSNLYGSREFLNFTPTAPQHTRIYQLHVFGWWTIFQLFLLLSQLPFGTLWNYTNNLLAEKAMLAGYDVIGDSYEPGRAWWMFEKLAKHIAYKKIKNVKTKQVNLYQNRLQPIWNNDQFFQIPFSISDAGYLRGFPIGLQLKSAQKTLNLLRSKGFLTRFELNDSSWAKKQKIVYLPLGPHLKEEDIENICATLRKTL